MIILDLKADNFYAFKNFHVNFTYPKKIVGSFIKDEHLMGRPNFRYKKINIIMGANASGKTTLGYMLMNIFNFIDQKNATFIIDNIADNTKEASFTIEMASPSYKMYRIIFSLGPVFMEDNKEKRIFDFHVLTTDVGKRDSYETCKARLDAMDYSYEIKSIDDELDKIEKLGWFFEHPKDDIRSFLRLPQNDDMFLGILNKILKALDPSIIRVDKLEEVKDSYAIRMSFGDLIIQNDEPFLTRKLSSGTKAGVEIATLLSSLIQGKNQIYYCDEKFSYIHTDIEKAILGVMIDAIKPNEQLFFTTHNVDVLEMQLPKHSFIFMKKDVMNTNEPIQCLSASDYLKRNTDSIKKAVENDLFSIAPSTEAIYEILELGATE